MKKITINAIRTLKASKVFAIMVFLMYTGSLLAQTVTDVFPTRVTTNSVVTIIGSGFTSSTSITMSGISINNSSITLISATEMSFEVSSSINVDRTRSLNVAGVPSGFSLDYIAPTDKVLLNGPTSNVTKITEIFTTYNGFWRSSEYKNNPGDRNNWPNDSHDLLAFTYADVTYSTGVNDNLLSQNGIVFSPQLFFAYTTDGVSGKTQPDNYLATGDLVDGEVDEGIEITSPAILGSKVYDVIVDGVNGLDLGTGITNFNATDDVQFFSAGGNLGAVDDVVPDFLVTQIANAGGTDIYYYADAAGNVVGRPIKINIVQENETDGDALLAEWRLDLYGFPNGINYGLATPSSRAFTANEKRPIRMVAFRMEEFDINATNVLEINNINLVAGGTSDIAFLAYNRGSFDIKTPIFSQFPVSRFVCGLPSDSEITFVSTGVVSGGSTGDPQETIAYQWYKYNTAIPGATSSSYALTGTIQSSDLASYKVRISNTFGAVTAAVTLSEGGTPTFWDGTDWVLPPTYVAAGITVTDKERDLVFSEDYTQDSGVLEGCNCTVPSGSNVTISPGATLKLVRDVIVENDGSLTIENDASLIQTKNHSENSNTGAIVMERELASAITDDFIFWSAPVELFDVAAITNPNAAQAFIYDVSAINTDGTAGDFISASGVMLDAKGYSVQVPNEFVPSGFTASFEGKAANGTINIDVFKSPSPTEPVEELRHWNLIGNPYPSAINVEEFLTENTALEGNVRFWSNGNTGNTALAGAFYTGVAYNYGDQYVTYNRTGSTPDMFGGNIASGQGFFVQVDESAGPTSSVAFNNTMRFDAAEIAYDNSQFIETNQSSSVASNPNNQLVWLSLVDTNDAASVALVGYVSGATNGNDRMYDAFSDGGALRIYSILGGSKMAIQGRALPFNAEDVVPLGMDLPSSGSYTIGIDQLQGNIFDQTQGIFLEDTSLNVVHDLRAQPYSFIGLEGGSLGRFVLRYNEPLAVDEDELDISGVLAFIKGNQLNIQSSSTIKDVAVYDLTGKQVMHYTPDGNDTTFTAPFNFAKGVYLAVIGVGDQNPMEVTRKVMN
jgi:hypothetical protein